MTGISVLAVDKTGEISVQTIKDFSEDMLYKKAGLNSPNDFLQLAAWNISKFVIKLFGKESGRALTENKYDFPPPCDNLLLFGTCILVQYDLNGRPVSLSIPQWKLCYDHLFGGFHNIVSNEEEEEDEDEEEEEEEEDEEEEEEDEDEEEEEEDEEEAEEGGKGKGKKGEGEMPLLKKTRHGYTKDGFVVDSDSNNDSDNDSTTENGTKSNSELHNLKEKENNSLDVSGGVLSAVGAVGGVGGVLSAAGLSFQEADIVGSELSEEDYE